MVGAVMIGKPERKNSMTTTQGIPLDFYLWLSAGLFTIGVLGVLFREMLSSYHVHRADAKCREFTAVAFSNYYNDGAGQVFVFFIMAVAAAEVAVGLAILIVMYRNTRQQILMFE